MIGFVLTNARQSESPYPMKFHFPNVHNFPQIVWKYTSNTNAGTIHLETNKPQKLITDNIHTKMSQFRDGTFFQSVYIDSSITYPCDTQNCGRYIKGHTHEWQLRKKILQRNYIPMVRFNDSSRNRFDFSVWISWGLGVTWLSNKKTNFDLFFEAYLPKITSTLISLFI